MPSISVRKIDENTLKQLRSRALEHGVSMEEEVRQILKRAVATPEDLGDLAMELFVHSAEMATCLGFSLSNYRIRTCYDRMKSIYT